MDFPIYVVLQMSLSRALSNLTSTYSNTDVTVPLNTGREDRKTVLNSYKKALLKDSNYGKRNHEHS